MTLIGPERDMLAVGVALNEQCVRCVLTQPGEAARRCVVKIPRDMMRCAAALRVFELLNRAGLVRRGDHIALRGGDWRSEILVPGEIRMTNDEGRREGGE